MQPVVERFRPLLESYNFELVVPPVNERMEEADLIQWIGDIDGVICGDDRFTARVLQHAPRLKVISKWGTGIDSIDQDACRRHAVAIRNTPDAFSAPVADSVLGYILCFARRLPWMDRAMRGGHWEKIPGIALSEATLGVIGVGNVGKAVMKRAKGFGMTLLGNDTAQVESAFLVDTGADMVTLEELLRRSDFVSVNCDLNTSTQHLLSRREFAAMKESAVVVNSARGPIIDERALIAALENGEIGGAALDVYEDEPLPLESPLRHMKNVMLAPHNSNSSPTAWERVHENTIRNLVDVLNAVEV